uniref:Probable thymidylate kinase n=1 Tax=Staphylothermus marinus TaxID=2280 RepID=A0A7C4H965_STAMA
MVLKQFTIKVKNGLSSNTRGLFIVLEGIDGSGKTSIAHRLIIDLEKNGYRTKYTFEPYTSLYIDILKNNYSEYRDAYLDALTYAVDRIIHLKTDIIPSIEKGEIVVCDRYFYSSVAYQSAQGAPYEWVLNINKIMLKPDLAIYLDVDPATGLKRKKGLVSRFPEYENIVFLSKVRDFYLKMVSEGYLKLVDASRDFESVYNDVFRIVERYLYRLRT